LALASIDIVGGDAEQTATQLLDEHKNSLLHLCAAGTGQAFGARAEAAAGAPGASPFTGILEALERQDMSALDEAVRFLAVGASPEPQQGAVAGALAGLLKASADPTGINRVAVARAGAIPPLLQLLRCPLSDVQLQAAWALHNLTSKNTDNKEAVVKENGVAPLVSVLRSGTPEAKAQVVGVLRNLTGGSIVCKAAVDMAGAIPSVVALMAKGSAAPQVQANLAVILYNLCKDSGERRSVVAKSGAVAVLVSTLGCGIPQVQQEAADALRMIVSGSREQCAHAVSTGVAPVLGVAMGSNATPKLRQQAGLLKKELLRCGGPDVLKALH